MRSNLDSRLSPSPCRYLLIDKGGKGERAWDRSKLPALETPCLFDPLNYNGIISHLISKRGGGGRGATEPDSGMLLKLEVLIPMSSLFILHS